MNDLIERYIYDVTNRLPESSRAEVKKELRANIDDMLPPNATEQDVRKVLVELGSPRILASSYRNKQRYLVSPEWMDDYIKTLKIVMVVFGSIALVFGLIEHILHPEAVTAFGVVMEVLGAVTSEVAQSLFQAFAVVTLIFVAIEASSVKNKCETWNPDSLPKLPKANVIKIGRTESIVGLVMTIIFGSIFIFWLTNDAIIVSWINYGPDWQMSTTVFLGAAIDRFLPIFIISLLLDAGVYIVKIIYGHWNYQVALIYSIEKIFSFAVFIAFVMQPDLFNPAFLTEAYAILGAEAADLLAMAADAAKGLFIFLGILVSIDLIATWVKTFKGKPKEAK